MSLVHVGENLDVLRIEQLQQVMLDLDVVVSAREAESGGSLDRGRETGDRGHVERSAADVALLSATVDQGGELDLTAYDERSDSSRTFAPLSPTGGGNARATVSVNVTISDRLRGRLRRPLLREDLGVRPRPLRRGIARDRL